MKKEFMLLRLCAVVSLMSLVLCAPGHAAPFAYITNTNSNTVSVIDTQTDAVVGDAIPVGHGPSSIGVSPDGLQVYVSNQDANTVSVIDTATNTVIGDPIAVGNWPCGIAFGKGGARAFVANCGSGKVSVIDTATRTVVYTTPLFAGDPIGAAANPAGTYVYVTDNIYGTITRIDTSTNAVYTSDRKFNWPNGITVSPDGALLYVTDTRNNALMIVNASTFALVASVPVGGNPVCVALNSEGTRAYVTNFGPSSNGTTVSVIDTAQKTVLATITVGSAPEGVSVSPDGSKVYVVNKYSNNVSVIDAATYEVLKAVPVGSNPTSYGQFIQQTQSTATLTVLKSGSGVITSSPAGIDCGSTCSSTFDTGTPITLTATPGAKYMFYGWSGGSCTGDDACTFTLTGNLSLTATFLPIPGIKASPASINFGSVKKDKDTSRTVTVKNAGAKGSLLTVDGVTMAGANQGEFTADASACSDPLEKDGTCAITVTLAPNSYGSKAATLEIASNDQKKAITPVKLAGKAAPPKMSVSPASLNFGTVARETSSVKKVKVSNTGTSDLAITSVSAPGDSSYGVVNNCATLTTKQSCTIDVTFTPKSAGEKNTSITIVPGYGSTATVALKGKGK